MYQKWSFPLFHQGKKIWHHTTSWDNIALKDAHRVSQNEVTKKLVAYTYSAGKNCLSKISNCKIDQDPVQRVTEFLELCCGNQDKTIGEHWQDDHEKHPDCCNIVNPSRSNVVIGTLKGIWVGKKSLDFQVIKQVHNILFFWITVFEMA